MNSSMISVTSARRTALVLDFGGVISRTLFETHAHSERALGLAPGTLNWRGPFDPANDALWRAMLADQISERDYWRIRTAEVSALLGETWTEMHTFVQRARGTDVAAVIRPEATDAISQAKARGCKVGILTNELDLFYGAAFRASVPCLREVDALVDATYTGILKPDARAYQQVADALGVPLAECVFVDDQQRNVEGALKAGMQAVQFDVRCPAAGFATALAML